MTVFTHRAATRLAPTALLLATLAGPAWSQTAADGGMAEEDAAGMAGAVAADGMADEEAGGMDGGGGSGGMGGAGGSGDMDGEGMAMEGASSGMMEGGMAMEGMADPEPMHVFFETGSAAISPDQLGVVDAAMRTFRDGGWVVIEISGVADTVGAPRRNLELSFRRAQSVANALMARGLDPAQVQLRARGISELEVPTGQGVSERGNRVAEITWR